MQPDEIAMRFARVTDDLADLTNDVRACEKEMQTHLVHAQGHIKTIETLERDVIQLKELMRGNGHPGIGERIRALEKIQDERIRRELETNRQVAQLKLALIAAVLSAVGNVATFVVTHVR